MKTGIFAASIDNRFLVETLHEKNESLFEPNPFSSSKRMYELDKDSDSDHFLAEALEKKKKTPRRKRQRTMDPFAPKRPLNVFMVFSEMQRDVLRKERKDLEETMPDSEDLAALRNLSKACAARWKVLPEEEKQS